MARFDIVRRLDYVVVVVVTTRTWCCERRISKALFWAVTESVLTFVLWWLLLDYCRLFHNNALISFTSLVVPSQHYVLSRVSLVVGRYRLQRSVRMWDWWNTNVVDRIQAFDNVWQQYATVNECKRWRNDRGKTRTIPLNRRACCSWNG